MFSKETFKPNKLGFEKLNSAAFLFIYFYFIYITLLLFCKHITNNNWISNKKNEFSFLFTYEISRSQI